MNVILAGVKQRVDVERNDRIYNSITEDTKYDVNNPRVFWSVYSCF